MGGVASTVQTPQTSGSSGGGKVSNAASTVNDSKFTDPAMSGATGMLMNAESNAQATPNKPVGINRPNYGYPTPMGKGGYTNSATSGQPTIGSPNRYSNTVGVGDNRNNSTAPSAFSGKAKGV